VCLYYIINCDMHFVGYLYIMETVNSFHIPVRIFQRIIGA